MQRLENFILFRMSWLQRKIKKGGLTRSEDGGRGDGGEGARGAFCPVSRPSRRNSHWLDLASHGVSFDYCSMGHKLPAVILLSIHPHEPD